MDYYPTNKCVYEYVSIFFWTDSIKDCTTDWRTRLFIGKLHLRKTSPQPGDDSEKNWKFGWKDGRTTIMNDGRKNGRTDWQTDGLTDDGGTDGWRRDWRTDGWLRDWRTEGLMDRRTEGRTDGRTDRRTDGRTDGWTDERYGSNTFYDVQGRFCDRGEILFNTAMLKCLLHKLKFHVFQYHSNLSQSASQ